MIHVLTLCARIMQMTSICLFKLTFIGYCKSFFFGKYSVKVVKHKTFFSIYNLHTEQIRSEGNNTKTVLKTSIFLL